MGVEVNRYAFVDLVVDLQGKEGFDCVIVVEGQQMMRTGPYPTEPGARGALDLLVRAFTLGFEHGAMQATPMSRLCTVPIDLAINEG